MKVTVKVHGMLRGFQSPQLPVVVADKSFVDLVAGRPSSPASWQLYKQILNPVDNIQNPLELDQEIKARIHGLAD
jgi:hypothetical protein